MYYENIKYNTSAEDIYKRIGKNESLMSEKDHAFLCGLVEKYKPQKILEVGVYAGGTTIAILDMLQRFGLGNSQLYSVDLAVTVEHGKKVGYMVEETKEYLNNIDNFHLFTGVVAPEVLEQITENGKFDFAIIDTAHYLPGEILDFLVCYPFMKEGSIVVLHDVMLNQKDKHRASATKVVFDVVVGEKIWNWNAEKYPNIAAVKLNKDTGKYIKDLISALSLSWYYDPGKEILGKYRNIVSKCYDDEALALFDKLVKHNQYWWEETTSCINRAIADIVKMLIRDKDSRLFIYGTGKMGMICLDYLVRNSLKDRVAGFIVSDDQEFSDNECRGIQIYKISEVQYRKDKDIIINSVENVAVSDMLEKKGIMFIKLSGIVKEAILIRA